MKLLPRRQTLRYTALSLPLFGGILPAIADEREQPPSLAGKNCLIIGPDGALAAAMEKTAVKTGARVTRLSPTAMTDDAWSKAVLTGSGRPIKADLIVNLAMPERNGGVGTVDLNAFNRVIEASYAHTFLALKYGVQLLQAGGGGSIVSVTSIDGKIGAANAAASCAAASGIIIMVKSAAIECAGKQNNVRVNALLVGDLADAKQGAPPPGQVTADDVASAVAYLGADASVYLTGLIMQVDNGGRPT